MKTVDLHQAFVWTCDNCGTDQFERAITLSPESVNLDDLPDGVVQEYLDWTAHGMGAGDFLMCPAKVTCARCGETFENAETAD